MEDLLEDYKRRLKIIMGEIKKGGNDLTLNRLGTKSSCYRTFITELERALATQQPQSTEQQCNIADVSQQRELLTAFMRFCENCVDETWAKEFTEWIDDYLKAVNCG